MEIYAQDIIEKEDKMKEGTILTLALSETFKGKYHIVAYLKEYREFVSFNTTKFRDNKRVFLDIGAYSKLTFNESNTKGEIVIGNNILLIDSMNKNEFIDFLDDRKVNYFTFKRNIREKFSIVESTIIEDILINRSENTIDSYVIVILNGEKVKMKVKDYRWIKYWEHILDTCTLEEIDYKKKHYIDFFNRRKVYFLLYRYKNTVLDSNRFRNINDICWISSIFYK